MGLVDPVRLCKQCEAKAKKDNIFCNKYLGILTTGAKFTVTEAHGVEFICQLSEDHRAILFGGDCLQGRDPIELKRIIEVKNADNEQQSAKHQIPASEVNGLSITYKPKISDEELTITLMVLKEKEHEATAGKEWLLSLKKVCK
jgi:hypothetical protein